jgi:flagellar biosynthesis protein FlhF
MRIKRFEAPTIQEALVKVKKDLGPEAIILYTKTFKKGGVLGFFGTPMAEITAGVDLNLLDDMAKRKGASRDSVVSYEKDVSTGKNLVTSSQTQASTYSGSLDSARVRAKTLQRELNEMKTSGVFQASRSLNSVDSAALLSEGFARLKKKLLRQEVEDFLIQKIIKGMISEKIDPDKNEEVFEWLNRFVSASIKVVPSVPISKFQKVIAFVGPTGVGKTTTIAKLGARFSLMERKKVAMITADTYRIAATEQLKTYGRIMGIPVEVADSGEDMIAILNRYKNMDVILVDTAGRSPSSDEQLEELKNFIAKSQPDEIHLVLSATTKYFDMIRIIERFRYAVP